ncbi:MAG: mechanosensitive ion channel [Pirellulaceae bacterium]|nr:mechanosensitive ion channel [Pirellulaceae bacterium]
MDDSDKTKEQAAKLINDLQDINFVKIVVILFAAWLIIFLAQKLLPILARNGPSKLRLTILNVVPIVRLLAVSFAILRIFPIVFNVTFQNFLVIAGGASVAIGFAFKDYVSSLIAGVVATFERPYRPGDWVEIDGDYGEVKVVGMRALSLVTPSDDVITIPHKKLWEQNISNSNDGQRTLMCVTHFYLTPDHSPALVRDLLRVVAMTSAYLEYDKPVLVMLENQPWGTHYKVKAYPFDMRDQFAFVSDITVRGKAALAELGIEEAAVLAPLENASRTL